jgi:hypothetical protein
MDQNNEVSFNNVWFSDEAHFHLYGVVNKQIWDFGRVIHEKAHHASRITVWAAISNRRLLQSIFFEETVNSERYLNMLCNTSVPHLLVKVCRYKLGGSCRMEPCHTHSEFCFGLSA